MDSDTKFYCLFVDNAAPLLPDIWDEVDQTIRIDLDTFVVTPLDRKYDVSKAADAKTTALYMRHIKDGGSFTIGNTSSEETAAPWVNTMNPAYYPREKGTTRTMGGYFIAVYQLTEAQYKKIMAPDLTGKVGQLNTDKPMRGDNSTTYGTLTGINFSWNAIRGGIGVSPTTAPANDTILDKLRKKVSAANDGLNLPFDMPTEAQWEYACRAGTRGTFSDSNVVAAIQKDAEDRLKNIGWFTLNNSPAGVKDVGGKPMNPAGIYDFHGNVYEWCLDQWDGITVYPASASKTYVSTTGPFRVVRGGGFATSAVNCRSAIRFFYMPANSFYISGLRLAATYDNALP
jgi:formylglycine-generating enzyme required for sulfatase activity